MNNVARLLSMFHVLVLLGVLDFSSLNGEETKHALLVGCTKYANLARHFQLEGPINDVQLMRQTLVDRFQFDSGGKGITILSESIDSDGRPTKQNILNHLQRLSNTVKPGEPVVILLAGHGSQQPDNPNDPDEPDGLDEVFLPCDVGSWDDEVSKVENALVDDELGSMVKHISDRGALVWLILDSCHSGSGLRGGEAEVSRHLDSSELVPKEILDQVSAHPKLADDDSESLFDTSGGLVAFYAARPSETTPEKSFPLGAPPKDQQRYGLLTYTLCSLLSQQQRLLTYDELLQGVTNRYAAMNRVGPTPMLEGNQRDSVVLGKERMSQSRPIVLTKVSRRPMTINAGSFHGIYKDTILAAYPPIGATELTTAVVSAESPKTSNGVIGYLRVTESDANSAQVEPVAYEDIAKRSIDHFLDKGRCTVEVQSIPPNRLKVGIQDESRGSTVETSPTFTVEQAEQLSSNLFQWTDQLSDAQWILKREPMGWALIPSGSHSVQIALAASENLYTSLDSLSDAIERIARAGSLLQLASMNNAAGLGYESRVLRPSGEPLQPGKTGFSLKDGDRVVVEFSNQGRRALDFTILYVDADHGITCLFPKFGELNRFEPGESERLRLQINAETVGREHLVTIAVRATGQPVDFAFLQQPSLRQDQSRGNEHEPESPLRELCKSALYGVGQTRGVTVDAWSNYEIRSISWTISAE